MPANPTGNARSAQPAKSVRRKKKPVVRKVPSQTQIAAAQEQTYKSQAHAVRLVGNQQRGVSGSSPSGDRPQGRSAAMTSPTVAKVVKSTRKRVLDRRDRGAGTRAVVRELEGKGVLAKLTSSVGDSAAQNIRAHGIGGKAIITSPASSSTLPTKLAIGTAKDFANAPSAVAPSLYVPAAGAVEAAQGRPARLKEFLKSIDSTDPVYNTVAAGVDAIGGNSKGAKKRLDAAWKAATEHPGFTALEVYGVGKGTDALAGRVARTGVAGKRIKTAAATEGTPKTLPGTALEQPRPYPKGPVQKTVAVVKEKQARAKARDLRAQAHAVEESDPVEAARLHSAANKADPDRIQPGEIKRRVDESVAAHEDIRRLHRSKVIDAVKGALKGVKSDAHPAVVLTVQRIAHATADDLKAYRDELASVYKTLGPAEKAANAQLRKHIDDALKQPDHLAEVEAAAQRYHDVVSPLQQSLVDRDMLGADQAARSAVMPYAVRRMGATHTAEHREAAAVDAKARLDNTRARVSRLEDERNRLVGAQRVTRGRDAVREPQVAYQVGDHRFTRHEDAKAHANGNGGVERIALTSSEAARVGERARVDRALAKAHADLKQHEGAYRDAKAVRNKPELVDANGKPLTTDAIRAHMAENGVSEPAFMSQAPNRRGAFNIRGEVAQAISNRRRTGQATRHGTFDVHPDTLVENAARMQGLADAADAFRSHVSEFALRGGGGKVKALTTRKQAETLRDNLNAQGDGHKWAIVRVHPWGARREQLERLLHDANSDDQLAQTAKGNHSPIVQAQLDALDGTGDGPFALMPEEAAKRFREHLSSGSVGTAGKVGRMVSGGFRKTVLATSVPWLTGNVVEAAARSLIARAGPRSYYVGRKTIRKLAQDDARAAEQAQVRITGGGHLSSASRQHIRTDAEQFAGTSLEPLAQAMGSFWRKPVPKLAARAWQGWTHFVFDTVNATAERQFQTAMLGKTIRSSKLMDGHMRKTSEAAIADAAEGLKGTNAQVEFGRAVDRMYGRYSKLAPWERSILTLYTPFAMWARNAVSFVLDVLPRDHPVTTALIASTENATAEWRKEHGLDKWAENAMPAWLQGSIPTSGGAKLRISRYLPFGFFSDPGSTISQQVLPQISAVQNALAGRDWKGDKLNGEHGPEASDAQKFAAAIHAFASATVPGLGLAERVAGKGAGKAVDPFPIVKNPVPKSTTVTKAAGAYDPAGSSASYDSSYKP